LITSSVAVVFVEHSALFAASSLLPSYPSSLPYYY
jgi:hypothetical protein